MHVMGREHVRAQDAAKAPGAVPEIPDIPKAVVIGDKADKTLRERGVSK